MGTADQACGKHAFQGETSAFLALPPTQEEALHPESRAAAKGSSQNIGCPASQTSLKLRSEKAVGTADQACIYSTRFGLTALYCTS